MTGVQTCALAIWTAGEGTADEGTVLDPGEEGTEEDEEGTWLAATGETADDADEPAADAPADEMDEDGRREASEEGEDTVTTLDPGEDAAEDTPEDGWKGTWL